MKVFAEKEEVERLLEQLNGLTAAWECFVRVMGLGAQRALAHERNGELLLELRKASTRLHGRYCDLQDAAVAALPPHGPESEEHVPPWSRPTPLQESDSTA